VDYFLTEEQQMIREIAAKIATEKVRPVRAELDESEEFPWDIMKILAQSDLFGIYLPEEYGGSGGGVFENCLAIEEMARACISVATTFAASGLGAYPILLYGSEEQKQKYLSPIASGEKLAAFGVTEANAGSDAGGIQTTAKRDGDHYVLNGTKQWITNAQIGPKVPGEQARLLLRKEIRAFPSARRKKRWVSGPRPPGSSFSTIAASPQTDSLAGKAWVLSSL